MSRSVLSLFYSLSSVSHSTIYFQAEDIPTRPNANEATDDVAAAMARAAEAEKVSINSYVA